MRFKTFMETKMTVYRGAGPRGMEEMRPSEGGVHGPGVYFYDNEVDATSYAGVGGGLIIGEVDTDDPDVTVTEPQPVMMPGSDIILRYHRIIVVRDPSKVRIIDRKMGA
jgi:hypothetical protein